MMQQIQQSNMEKYTFGKKPFLKEMPSQAIEISLESFPCFGS